MLQGIDGARAAARRLGELFAADGSLAEADDVFFFTVGELRRGLPPDARVVVNLRKQRHADYSTMALPGNWVGAPEPILADVASDPDPLPSDNRPATGILHGIGVSGGQVVGTARIVENPDFVDVEPDEILVAATTDPSWSSIMFLSRALIVDVGGALSHAAVVARELEIPCVVNTRTGTSVLRTGDQIRVDGDRGTVEILRRVGNDGGTATATTAETIVDTV